MRTMMSFPLGEVMMNSAKAVGLHTKTRMKESFVNMLEARGMVMVLGVLPLPMLYQEIVGGTAIVLQGGEMIPHQAPSELIPEIAAA